MQFSWLNKQNNKNLIVFFAGWSFDEKPFEFLACEDCDVLFVYDYSAAKQINVARQLGSYAAKFSEDQRSGGQEGKPVNEISLSELSQSQQTDKNLSTLQPFNHSTNINAIPQSQKSDNSLPSCPPALCSSLAASLPSCLAAFSCLAASTPYRPIALSPYSRKYLLTWSMGAYVAYQMRDLFKDFDEKIAINGTPFPVDNDYGIPEKPFLLTLRHAKTGLEGKFYQNIFDKSEEYEKYLKNSVERSIENRVTELQNLYDNIKNSEKTYEKFYDKAFVSLNDKIIPPKNQLKFWQDFDVPVEKLESGHFPYYNFNAWKDFL